MEMKFRHELKYFLSYADYISIRQRLKVVLPVDSHAQNGIYLIRSLYFDNLDDKALVEKIDGVNRREKFRIRFYNNDLSHINLEKKSKINGLCNKQSATIDISTAQKILSGNIAGLKDSTVPLLAELYQKMTFQGLQAKTIVDYRREPFVFKAGNVRVTLDSDIRTGKADENSLSPNAVTMPAGDIIYLLEVKFDEFLPDIVRDIVQTNERKCTAFSKYAQCRIYG